MENRIKHTDLLKAASLAKINLNEQEIEQYAADLNAIINYAECLKEIDVADIEPMISPIMGQSTPMREDLVAPSLSQANALKEASQVEAGHFRVPKTIEG